MATDIPILVINLDRSVDRLIHAERELAGQGLTLTRLRAVDARALTETDIAAVLDPQLARRTYYSSLMNGEIACFLSHRLAWKMFLTEWEAPFAVILEDDFELHGNLRSVIDALTSGGPIQWDMIKLFARKKRVLDRTVAPITREYRLTRDVVAPTGTVGQIVSRRGAEKLLVSTLPIHRPIDVQLQHWWELGLDLLTIEPLIIGEVWGQIGGSLLRREKPLTGFDKVRREVGRTTFRMRLFAKSVYHFMRR